MCRIACAHVQSGCSIYYSSCKENYPLDLHMPKLNVHKLVFSP